MVCVRLLTAAVLVLPACSAASDGDPSAAQVNPGEGNGEGLVGPAHEACGHTDKGNGNDGVEMCVVEAGTFWMGCGSDADKECDEDELPGHAVDVPTFYMDRTEVTRKAYKKCMAALNCAEPACYWKWANGEPFAGDSDPVACLDREKAAAYCSWTGKRLCTEAEWEKAARGDDSRLYPWGDDAPACKLACFTDCSGGDTCIAGASYDGDSPYGLHDMAGNVWEWVADAYHETYDGAPADGSAWTGAAGQLYVRRGGGFDSPPALLRASARSYSDPAADVDRNQGFRCCRSGE